MNSKTYYDHRSHQLLPALPAGGGANASHTEIFKQPNLLASTKLKIDGADDHLKDLSTLINAFFHSDPHPFRSYVDTEGTKQVFKVQLLNDLPGPIYARIGDVLSNTRSALDHLASALAVRNGSTAKGANFPIARDQQTFEGKGVQGKEQMFGKEAWSAICGLKPYRGGNDLLWSLNELRNIDTHETVVPIAWGVTAANFNAIIELRETGDVDMAVSPIRFDENKVGRIWRVPANATIHDSRTQFSLDVGFTKVATVEGRAVIAVLQQFIALTRSTIATFEQQFFL